jgi:archaellum component FlaC
VNRADSSCNRQRIGDDAVVVSSEDWTVTVAAYCWWAKTLIPTGVLGANAAADLLDAFPAASVEVATDRILSAPELFRLLAPYWQKKNKDKIQAAAPSDRVMPAALRLVAAACPLIELRSARRFLVRFGSANDPASPLAAQLRERVTPEMLLAQRDRPAAEARRADLTSDQAGDSASGHAQDQGAGAAEIEVIALLTAFCEATINALPRGERGVEAAICWLRAFPRACRLGLGDCTDSAPGLFRVFDTVGLLGFPPSSSSSMTSAIRLIASVSPLITPVSARTWTAWMGSARDPSSELMATIRAAVTPTMLATRRPATIRSEHDRLTAELQAAHEAQARERRAAAEQQQALTAELQAAREAQARERRAAAEQQQALIAERDRLAAEHAAALKDSQVEIARRDRALRKSSDSLTTAQDKIAQIERVHAELQEKNQSQREQIQGLNDAYTRLNAHRDALIQRCDTLDNALDAASRAATEEHYRQSASTAELSRQLATKTRELADERKAHDINRQLLMTAEQHGYALLQENKRLKELVELGEGPRAALASLCTAISIDVAAHSSPEAQAEEIVHTIERLQRSIKSLMYNAEELLRGCYEAATIQALHRSIGSANGRSSYIEPHSEAVQRLYTNYVNNQLRYDMGVLIAIVEGLPLG